VLTGNDVHDASQVPALLKQIQGEIASVTADGAYDGEPIYRAMQDRQLSPVPTIIIPPRAGAVIAAGVDPVLSQRDHHIRLIQEQGRATWRRAAQYGERSLIETAIGRYKALIGSRLRARLLPNQQGEVALAAEVLNRMIRTGKPVSVRVA
jgi:hypothetical protein